MKTHPYADKYPMLPADELAELTQSIRANGLRQPIVLDTEGRILDGRNRYVACEKAGIQPQFTTYEGEDLAEYVIDCNTSRRHMSTGARAMATALILVEDRGREAGRWNGRAAISDVGNSKGWKQRISECGVVLDYAPHLAEKVRNDELPLNTAFEQAKAVKASAEAEKLAERNRARAEREAEKAEAERQARLLNELKANTATQFLIYIDTGEMDIPTAHAAWPDLLADVDRIHARWKKMVAPDTETSGHLCPACGTTTLHWHHNDRLYRCPACDYAGTAGHVANLRTYTITQADVWVDRGMACVLFGLTREGLKKHIQRGNTCPREGLFSAVELRALPRRGEILPP
ncbi:hypothetical protein HMPREF3167_06200 [Trueperella sp. HMSC08B05]|uniref:ParB N-terminal domain-containing protein n=1 Tax=Trueperella sp. HMSC08B05 TaxID=1581135 RepID=UPI0008A4A573|nr:ParB N-terminal domain-containing protein [Trueperella sp. HMSC08B05]OFS73873.1 hypothetical protein HMPREF3167_06200 [Trueperella sp. HMSC08B05]